MDIQHPDNEREVVGIKTPSEFHKILLAEIAHSRGYDVRIKRRSKTKLWVLCDKREAEDLLRTVCTAEPVLRLGKLKAVAAAVLAVGERPSEALLETIAEARSGNGLAVKGNRLRRDFNGDGLSNQN